MSYSIFFDSKSVLSDELIDSIKNSISIGKQSILLLDRRGYHTLARCFSCGESVMCKNCSTTLNHHKIDNQNKLICHYCGYIEDVSKKCKKCGNSKYNFENDYILNLPILKCRLIHVEIYLYKLPFQYKLYYPEINEKFKNYIEQEKNINKSLVENLSNYFVDELTLEEKKN